MACKNHLIIIDGLGNSISFMLGKGKNSDCDAAIDLLSSINIVGSNMIADKAYRIMEIHKYIERYRKI